MINDLYHNLKVLVTGATGFKGSWLSLWLSHLGADVTGYSKDIPTNPALFETLSLDKAINHVIGDVLDFSKLRLVYEESEPDIIFHLAAEPIVLRSYDTPRETFMTNALGTVNVLELARQYPSIKAVVVVTSDKCYQNIQQDHLLTESDSLGGSDPYSASKACAEIAFHAYFESFFKKLPTAIASARAGNVIGGGDWGLYRLLPDCMRAWSQDKPVEIRHPNSTRPWQHVLDVVYGYILLGEYLLKNPKKFSGQSFNFSPGSESYTTLELVQSLQKIWTKGEYMLLDQSSELKEEKEFLALDSEKARQSLGWRSRYNFHKSTEQAAKWYWNYYHEKKSIRQFTLDEIEAYERP